jgi:hypothetical protein
MDPNNPAGMGFVVNSDTQQSALAPPPPLMPDAAMPNLAMMPEAAVPGPLDGAGRSEGSGALLTLLGPTFAPVLSALTANSIPGGLPGPGCARRASDARWRFAARWRRSAPRWAHGRAAPGGSPAQHAAWIPGNPPIRRPLASIHA